MRELKFRAWDKKTSQMRTVKRMHFATSGSYTDNSFHVVYADLEDTPLMRKYGEFDIMQSIGLNDKYGNEIYEGDIIRYYGKILLVEYIQELLGFRLRVLNKPFIDNFTYDALSIFHAKEEIEIIDNIHKTPDYNQKYNE